MQQEECSSVSVPLSPYLSASPSWWPQGMVGLAHKNARGSVCGPVCPYRWESQLKWRERSGLSHFFSQKVFEIYCVLHSLSQFGFSTFQELINDTWLVTISSGNVGVSFPLLFKKPGPWSPMFTHILDLAVCIPISVILYSAISFELVVRARRLSRFLDLGWHFVDFISVFCFGFFLLQEYFFIGFQFLQPLIF